MSPSVERKRHARIKLPKPKGRQHGRGYGRKGNKRSAKKKKRKTTFRREKERAKRGVVGLAAQKVVEARVVAHPAVEAAVVVRIHLHHRPVMRVVGLGRREEGVIVQAIHHLLIPPAHIQGAKMVNHLDTRRTVGDIGLAPAAAREPKTQVDLCLAMHRDPAVLIGTRMRCEPLRGRARTASQGALWIKLKVILCHSNLPPS